ncbi:Kinesin-like protein bimC [Ceratocystis fimbriata CBS 114723]|uniref:Kinesin-like protein bimC n=1 Tax=Ceratocystis fimbriata CBS 114723 TaxID=1035309 RepID=A0A2C5X9L3_9PEZI|nr:Kinesin-like protein bimC [Ceratocystis fimbriata CBS 114723]
MAPPATRAASGIPAPGRRLTKRVSSARLPGTSQTSGLPPSRFDRSSRATSPAESVMSTATVMTSGGGAKRKERDFETDMSTLQGEETNINVVVRCRGRNDREIKENSNVVVMTDGVKGKTVELSMGPNAVSNKTYSFDRVFSPASDQTMVFDEVVKPMLDEMLAGYNCTIFAYGQTGTGKTYTMSGDMTETLGLLSDNAGIIPRVLQSLFQQLELESTEHCIKCSFIELYNEELRDLVTSDDSVKLKIYEDNSRRGHPTTVVQGVEEKFIRDAAQGIKLLQDGSMKRQVAATKCNDLSSRSHTVFTITSCIKRVGEDGSEDFISAGKLNLVDLAGSENIQRSGAENKRAAEAGLINKSLLTLGRVINALVDRGQHIPYRESKLTRLLQDSLGGRTKTCIIATISPAKVNLEETISTLDYAFRAKNIRNKPQLNAKINRKALLQEFATEIERLKAELIATRQRNGVYLTNETFEEMTATSESRRIVMGEQSAKIETLETNLRNKAQELWNLTTTFSGLKKDHESTTQTLSETKGVLEHTEIVLSETRRTLEGETEMRKAHAETESKLAEVGDALISTIKRTVGDVDGLHAKNRRKSDLQAINRDAWGNAQSEVVDVTRLVERRVQEFRDQQEESLTKMSGRMRSFVTEEIDKLSVTQDLLDNQLDMFTKSKEDLLHHSGSSKDAMDGVLGEIREVRDAVKQRVGESLNEISKAAERIAADVLEEMAAFHNQLHSSYTGLGADFKTLFEQMLQHMAAQKAETDGLRQQLATATSLVVQQNTALSTRVQQAIESERRQATADRQKLLAQITSLIDTDAAAREERLASQSADFQSGISQSTSMLQSETADYSQSMDILDKKHLEFVDTMKQSSNILKSRFEDDWTTANTQSEGIQKAARSVHAETVRIVQEQVADLDTHMVALDDFVTRAKEENSQNHASNVAAIGQVTSTVEKSFETISSHFATTFDRVNSLGETMEADAADAISQLDPIQGNICQPLADLRTDISSRQIREYTATGSTPKRVQYTFPTTLPRTVLPSKLAADAEDSVVNDERDKEGDVVFTDVKPLGPPSPKVADLTPPSGLGLREVNPNTSSLVFEHTVTTTIPLATDSDDENPATRFRKNARRLTAKKANLLEGRENQLPHSGLAQSLSRRKGSRVP